MAISNTYNYSSLITNTVSDLSSDILSICRGVHASVPQDQPVTYYRKVLADTLQRYQYTVDISRAKPTDSFRPTFIVHNKILLVVIAGPDTSMEQEDSLQAYMDRTGYTTGLVIHFGSPFIGSRCVIRDTSIG